MRANEKLLLIYQMALNTICLALLMSKSPAQKFQGAHKHKTVDLVVVLKD